MAVDMPVLESRIDSRLRKRRYVAIVALVLMALTLSSCRIVTVAGGGTSVPGNGMAATDAHFQDIWAVERHPAGGVVFTTCNQVFRQRLDGTLQLLYTAPVPCPENQYLLSPLLGFPAVRSDGTVYVPVSDPEGDKIMRIDPEGVVGVFAQLSYGHHVTAASFAPGDQLYISTLWAGHSSTFRYVGGSAPWELVVQASFASRHDFAVSSGGTIYGVLHVVSGYFPFVSRITPPREPGQAGTHEIYVKRLGWVDIGTGGLRPSDYYQPGSVELEPDSSLLFVEPGRVSRITPDGRYSVVAGKNTDVEPSGDGGLAVNANLGSVVDVAPDYGGQFWVAASGRIRYVGLTPPSDPCQRPLMLGVRGSGEKQTDAEGYGKTVAQAIAGFRSVYGSNFETAPVDYTAMAFNILEALLAGQAQLDAFFGSVNEGAAALTLAVARHSVSCPERPLVLLGYSQGALVVDQYVGTVSAAVRNRIIGIGLIADPGRRGSATYNVGTARSDQDGIVRSDDVHNILRILSVDLPDYPELPPDIADNTVSLCDHGDPICATPAISSLEELQELDFSVHTAYQPNGRAAELGRLVGHKAKA